MSNPSKPRCLLIETSGTIGHVGLGLGDALLGEAALDRSRQHTRDLIPHCQRLCEQQEWQPKQLDVIVVSAGPGSYTGLRVGMMTAKTLAYALNKPLISVPTFEIIAHQNFAAVPSLQAVTVIGDGQQDKVYVQTFERQSEDGAMQASTELTILPGEPWRSSLSAGTCLTGPGLRQQRSHLPPTIQLLDEEHWDPLLPALLSRTLHYLNSQRFSDPFTLEPIYLRASSAEEQWAALGK